jgi:hypothetical protein
MYAGLRIPNTLHKKPCRIGPGLGGTSENAQNANFALSAFCEFRVATALPVFTYLLPRVCARLTPRYRGGCTLSVDLGVVCSFFHSFRSSQPSGWTLPLRLLLGLPVLSLSFVTNASL